MAKRTKARRAARPVEEALPPRPPIDSERVRLRAIDELLSLIARKSEPDDRRAAHNEGPGTFLLSRRALASVIPQDVEDGDEEEPEEHRFARCLLAFGAFGVADGMGLAWDHVLSGLVRLASGERLPTMEEITALRGKAAVAGGR